MLNPNSKQVDITLPLNLADSEVSQIAAAAKKLGISRDRIFSVKLRKRSIDARKKDIRILLRLEVGIDAELPDEQFPRPKYPALPSNAPRVIIVGSGPAGLFAALRLIELGKKPIVIERGKDVSARRFDLAPILRKGIVVEDSNYCFGEGGAGTFSDGKLYTRATKRGSVMKVYETFVAHGAPPEILTESHPHIGSNLLPNVVKAMRMSILDSGGEVHFGRKVIDFELHENRIIGVKCQTGELFEGEATILATGHSARDIYRLFAQKNLRLESKPFAVGVRIEHPQILIDRQQYHLGQNAERPENLPAASYSLATKIDNRGVHSFCMCPGGFIVPAATENDEVVVNGMSLSRRDSVHANSGLVVTVEPEDTIHLQPEHGSLAGIEFQKRLERRSKLFGGNSGQVAPAQLVPDFLHKRLSAKLNGSSYFPGLISARIDELLPQGIVKRLSQGLKLFEKQIYGFSSNSAQLIGVETRTSSPIRIPRSETTLEHPEIERLLPCGEGAGYAGGIVSAAFDGIRCADSVSKLI